MWSNTGQLLRLRENFPRDITSVLPYLNKNKTHTQCSIHTVSVGRIIQSYLSLPSFLSLVYSLAAPLTQMIIDVIVYIRLQNDPPLILLLTGQAGFHDMF